MKMEPSTAAPPTLKSPAISSSLPHRQRLQYLPTKPSTLDTFTCLILHVSAPHICHGQYSIGGRPRPCFANIRSSHVQPIGDTSYAYGQHRQVFANKPEGSKEAKTGCAYRCTKYLQPSSIACPPISHWETSSATPRNQQPPRPRRSPSL